MSVEYRLFLRGEAAPADFAHKVDEVTVDQAIDAAWEARLTMRICADDQGNWTRDSEILLATAERVRVEVRNGGDWVPLIDGPAVGVDLQLSGSPGQSSMVLISRDDTVYLDRTERTHAHTDRSDSEIAQQIFHDCAQITQADVHHTTSPTERPGIAREVTQRETDIAFLRRLARRNGMYAYVLPGDEANHSRGVFGPLPGPDADRLSTLILAGEERNIESFQAGAGSSGSARTLAAYIDIAERTTVTHTASLRDTELLGQAAAVADEESTVLAEPGAVDETDPETAARADRERRGYVIRAYGSVVGRCYHGVLSPYRLVGVRGINQRLSGAYVVASVTHRLSRTGYEQQFELWRDALSEGAGEGFIPSGIF